MIQSLGSILVHCNSSEQFPLTFIRPETEERGMFRYNIRLRYNTKSCLGQFNALSLGQGIDGPTNTFLVECSRLGWIRYGLANPELNIRNRHEHRYRADVSSGSRRANPVWPIGLIHHVRCNQQFSWACNPRIKQFVRSLTKGHLDHFSASRYQTQLRVKSREQIDASNGCLKGLLWQS